MAHGTIYQLSKTPVAKDNYITPKLFYDGMEKYADYIGDRITDEDRMREIEGLAHVFKGAFELDGENLVYRGIGEFTKRWTDEIKLKASAIEDGKYDFLKFYQLKYVLENFDTEGCRFYIENWNNSSDNVASLINFCQSKLQPGDTVYVGGLVDYHY